MAGPVRRPWFAGPGLQVPEGSLAVDGDVAFAAATYSHWQTAPPPPVELRADTSTAMALLAAQDPVRWLDPFLWVAIDHLDADGLLAVITACRPTETLPYRDLLLAAAAAGDFCLWGGDAAQHLTLRIHQHLAYHRSTCYGWEQRALDDGVDRWPQLVTDALFDRTSPLAQERQQAIDQVHRALQAVQDQTITITDHQRFSAICWQRVLGRGGDDFLAVNLPQDMPPIILSTVVSADRFQLLLEATPEGVVTTLDAPRHSWARTYVLPTVVWPDCSALANSLQTEEPGPVRWLARPEAAEFGFTTLLASVSAGNPHISAASHLPTGRILALVEAALGATPLARP